jgi:hypothetical protein
MFGAFFERVDFMTRNIGGSGNATKFLLSEPTIDNELQN